MNIHVGSTNKTKILAVKNALKQYPTLFPSPIVTGVKVDVEEFGHPKNIKETVKGAIERAKKAFVNCQYSIGLEGGLIKVPYSKSGYMETGVCAIYDGKHTFLGFAPSFEWPEKVTELIVRGKTDASQAFYTLGLTKCKKLGAKKGGIIGPLTHGRIPREHYQELSITMALIQLENPKLFQN